MDPKGEGRRWSTPEQLPVSGIFYLLSAPFIQAQEVTVHFGLRGLSFPPAKLIGFANKGNHSLQNSFPSQCQVLSAHFGWMDGLDDGGDDGDGWRWGMSGEWLGVAGGGWWV